MKPVTPKPEGSARFTHLDPDLAIACLPNESGSIDWAYGMPLSYVHETASLWLSLYDEQARLAAPAAPDGTPDLGLRAGDD